MNEYSSKAIIISISLCLVVFAGCKSDQPPATASSQTDTAGSDATNASVATDNTATAAPTIDPLAVASAPQKAPVAANGKFVGMVAPKPEAPAATPIIESGAQANASNARSASQDPVEVRNVDSQFSLGTPKGWQVTGELKNTSGKQLRKIELTAFLLDDKGKSLDAQKVDLSPSLIPSNINEIKKFSITVNAPSGWQGKAAVKATRVDF